MIPDYGINALVNMHQLLLEALRHREQAIIRYLAILGPALGGFIWLMQPENYNLKVFIFGTISVLILLLLGAIYSLALGYNYRYIVLELAKLETALSIEKSMLKGWPRKRKDFFKRYRLMNIPWCLPPEIIKVFWMTFIIGIVGVTVAACAYNPKTLIPWVVAPIGSLSLFLGLITPYLYGRKLESKINEEPEVWDALETNHE